MKKLRRLKRGYNSPYVSNTDPLGSYTGTGTFDDKPEQDADDL